MFKFATYLSILLFLAACGSQVKPGNLLLSDWQLNSATSDLSFVTTKNKTVAESHTLQFKQGQLNQQIFDASIDLNSVDTQIPIRDQRIRDLLFETAQYPVATINAQVPADAPLGQPIELPFTLNLHGQQSTMAALVLIQTVGEQLVVTSYEPVTVNGKDFKLDSGINQLTQIASLQGINYDVQVEFKLTFEK